MTNAEDPTPKISNGPTIPARDAATEFPSFDRSDRLLSLVRPLGVDVKDEVVADLGTGFGFLALGAARAGARRVIAVDANPERLSEVETRARQSGVKVHCVQANLLDLLPAVEPVQFAFMIGVIEYAGLWDLDQPVVDLQSQVFRTAYDALAEGGSLIVGTKNRVWPRFVVDDVHRHRPLLNVLPRTWADRLSHRLDGVPYRHHLHSPKGWRELLEGAGFRHVEVFYPHFSYQFPLLLNKKPSVGDITRIRNLDASPEEKVAALNRVWIGKAALMAAAASVGLPFSHSVVLKADK